MSKRIKPELNAENGLLGAFHNVFGRYSIWNEKGDRKALSSSEALFLMSLESDLELAKELLPDLTKELQHLKELINEELV